MPPKKETKKNKKKIELTEEQKKKLCEYIFNLYQGFVLNTKADIVNTISFLTGMLVALGVLGDNLNIDAKDIQPLPEELRDIYIQEGGNICYSIIRTISEDPKMKLLRILEELSNKLI
jgi:hypothetical protein